MSEQRIPRPAARNQRTAWKIHELGEWRDLRRFAVIERAVLPAAVDIAPVRPWLDRRPRLIRREEDSVFLPLMWPFRVIVLHVVMGSDAANLRQENEAVRGIPP